MEDIVSKTIVEMKSMVRKSRKMRKTRKTIGGEECKNCPFQCSRRKIPILGTFCRITNDPAIFMCSTCGRTMIEW